MDLAGLSRLDTSCSHEGSIILLFLLFFICFKIDRIVHSRRHTRDKTGKRQEQKHSTNGEGDCVYLRERGMEDEHVQPTFALQSTKAFLFCLRLCVPFAGIVSPHLWPWQLVDHNNAILSRSRSRSLGSLSFMLCPFFSFFFHP